MNATKRERIMRAIAALGRNAYGLRVCDAVDSARGSPEQSDTYRLLRRLESDGLVSSEWSEPSGERGGRRRRIYSLTAAGKVSLGMVEAAARTAATEGGA